jgi:hypothetical protein
MKAFHRSAGLAVVVVAVALGGAQKASAQAAPAVIHGDAAGTIGWLAFTSHPPTQFNQDDWISSFYAAGSAGWHWTDNLKAEVDFGAGTESRTFRTEQAVVDGHPTYYTVEARFSRRSLGVSQQYQFFHNVWFHPHVAVGANFTWQREREEPEPTFIYDPITQHGRFLPPVRDDSTRTSLQVNPFLAVGYKAYVSERAFLRNDLRVAFRGGINETTLRIGFGFDF